MKPIDTDGAMKDEVVVAPNFRARKQQAVREIIWDAALELFVQKGYDETTVDDIAQAAGISPRSFFRYFASKGDVMAYALMRFAELLIAAIESCPASDSLNQVFRRATFGVAQDALSEARTREVFKMLAESPSAEGAQMAGFIPAQRLITTALIRRFPEASMDELTATGVAGAMILLTGVVVRWCVEHREVDAEPALERLFPAFGALFYEKPRANGKVARRV